jgi:soluble lytic murein transglycosylase-like protein
VSALHRVSLLLFVSLLGLAPRAHADVVTFTDRSGVTHFTNIPADPRYQGPSALSGSAAGWLGAPPLAHPGYREVIREIAHRYGVSSGLVEAVIRVESGFNSSAVSSKGARGLMQLMPATAAGLGVRNAFDPRENIEGGVRHLRYLMDRFPDDLPLVLAAYNAGEGAVAQHRGIPPYPETREYVRRVLERHEGAAKAPVDDSRTMYRLQDGGDTITYTNVLPASGLRTR